MATSVLNSFSPNQSATINSLYNAWLASPYSNNPNVLYQAIGVANGEGNTARGSNGLLGMLGRRRCGWGGAYCLWTLSI